MKLLNVTDDIEGSRILSCSKSNSNLSGWEEHTASVNEMADIE